MFLSNTLDYSQRLKPLSGPPLGFCRLKFLEGNVSFQAAQLTSQTCVAIRSLNGQIGRNRVTGRLRKWTNSDLTGENSVCLLWARHPQGPSAGPDGTQHRVGPLLDHVLFLYLKKKRKEEAKAKIAKCQHWSNHYGMHTEDCACCTFVYDLKYFRLLKGGIVAVIFKSTAGRAPEERAGNAVTGRAGDVRPGRPGLGWDWGRVLREASPTRRPCRRALGFYPDSFRGRGWGRRLRGRGVGVLYLLGLRSTAAGLSDGLQELRPGSCPCHVIGSY